MMKTNRGENDIIVLIIEDYSGRKIMKLKAPLSDTKIVKQIFQSVIDKYSLGIKFQDEFKW